MITIQTDDKGIVVKNGDIQLLTGIEALAQDVQYRVLFNQGENPYDQSEGINYDGDVFGKFGGEEFLRNIYSEVIGNSSEITSVQNITFSRKDGVMTVNATCDTIFGEVNV